MQKRKPNRVIEYHYNEEDYFMLIAIDHGNYNIKTPNFGFMAGLAQHSVRPPTPKPSAYSGLVAFLIPIQQSDK